MFKTLQLLFEPTPTWDGIARAERGVVTVLGLFFLPAVLMAGLLEGFGLHKLGNRPAVLEFSHHSVVDVPLDAIVRYTAAEAVLAVAGVFLLASMTRYLFHSFHCRATFAQSFNLMAYSYGPVLIMQAVDGLPFLPTWICRVIGAALAVKVLYLGLVRVVRPDPATALGLYFLGSLLILATAGLTHFVALQVLEGGLLDHWLASGAG